MGYNKGTPTHQTGTILHHSFLQPPTKKQGIYWYFPTSQVPPNQSQVTIFATKLCCRRNSNKERKSRTNSPPSDTLPIVLPKRTHKSLEQRLKSYHSSPTPMALEGRLSKVWLLRSEAIAADRILSSPQIGLDQSKKKLGNDFFASTVPPRVLLSTNLKPSFPTSTEMTLVVNKSQDEPSAFACTL
ncbi:hypothetical protein BDD12DRAFT_30380 [Trichophaea hybrida]|nr:hypothetical protein BDD12DRAFT_30380 [Trichophaea hybrida]